jgi:fluoroquinolone transport system permease protein
MIWKILFNSFKADIKFVGRDPMLLLAMSAPVILVLFIRLIFPIISDFVLSSTGFQLDSYYTIFTLTLLSVIPMLLGLVYAFILLDENDTHILQVIAVTPAGKKNFLYMRMITPFFLSLVLILLSVVITKPVPYEGWLRTTFAAVMLSFQAPFVFLFIGSLAGNKVEGMAYSKLYGIFLIAVPMGLILHHPWNYFMFFSPLYWISWSWITELPGESLIYGGISMILTFGGIMILFRHFLRKHVS